MKNTKIETLLDQYGESHQNPTNQMIHKVCVPLIMFSLLGLLSRLPGIVNWSYVLVALGFLYYIQFKNLRLLFVVLFLFVPMLFFIVISKDFMKVQYWGGIFLLAWISQFICHKVERKKPSFFQDLFFLLIGPVWIARKFL